MTKKILSIVLSVLLLVSIVPNFAFAADTFTIAGNTVEYEIGQETKTVDITFTVSNNPGIATAGFEVKFNPAVMTYKGIKSYGDVFPEAKLTLGETALSTGSLYLTYLSGTENMTANGALITITFEMVEGIAAGDYSVEIIEDSTGEVSNVAGTPCTPTLTPAKVTVKPAAQDAPEAVVIMADDMTAVGGGSGGANVSTVEEGGMTYWRFDPKNPNNNGAAMHVTLNEAFAAAEYNFVKVGYKTNTATVTNRSFCIRLTDSTFNTTYKAATNYTYWPAEALTEVTTGDIVMDVTDKGDATEIQYVRILPTNGQVATAVSGTGEYYFDVAYIAFFATEAEADDFDFDAYVDSLYTVTFQNRLGADITTTIYKDGETVEFPEAPEVSGYTFVGWSADEGETFVEEGYVATADITLKAIYEEAEDEKDYDTLETFITILKMITAKKKAAADTPVIPTTFEGIIYNAEDILGGRAVTEGVDTYNGVAGKLAGGKTVFAAADGKVRFTNSNIGAAATTSDRAIIKVDDIKLTEYPFIGIKYNTNIAAENINFNLTTKDGTYTSAEQKLFFPTPRTVGADAACIAQYDGVKMGDAVATYIYVPIYSNTGAVSAAGDYFDVIAVGFFKTEADAKAFADYYGMKVEEPEAPVEEEPEVEEPVATGEPVIYTPADLLTQIAPLTGELSTVEVDGKVISSKKKVKLAPGEMENVVITTEMLKDMNKDSEIVVRIEE